MCSSSIVYNTTIYTATLSTEHVFSSPTTSFKVVSKYPKWTTYVCSDGDAFHITVSILSSARFGHRSGILEGSPDLNLASSSHATGFDVGRTSLFVFLVLDFEIQQINHTYQSEPQKSVWLSPKHSFSQGLQNHG